MPFPDDNAVKLATPKILTSAFRNGGLEFGSVFSTNSPNQRAQRGGQFLKFDTRSGAWRDLFTGTTGSEIVSFVAYGKAISRGASLALCKRACAPGDVLDGHTMRPVVSQNKGSTESDNADLAKLANRRMSAEQRRDALIQSVKDTLHSQFDRKRKTR